jgi:outer membrane receptor protein involved in Fe transport
MESGKSLGLAAALLLAGAGAFAQEQPDSGSASVTAPDEPVAEAPPQDLGTVPVQEAAPAETDTGDATRLDEITVTSQKRLQSIHDVPISVTALTNTMMFEQGVTDVREALQLVPNARVDSAGFFAAPRVRGFTLNNNNKSFEPPVGMVLDGIPHTRIEYFLAALMDTERMEVMRGPQGTTFGKNTTAGLIHLISYQPPSSPQGSLTIDAGELNRRHLEAAYGGPLTTGLNFRVSGLLDERDGYIENTTARVLDTAPKELKDRKRTGVRFAVEAPDLWGSTVLLGFENFQLYDGGASLETIRSGPAFAEAVRGYDPGADFTPGNWIHSQDFADFKDVTIQRTRFQWDRSIGDWEFVALGAYSVMDQDLSLDTDFTPAPAILGSGTDHSPESYGELRFTAPTLDGLLGLAMLPGDTDFLFGITGGRRQILDSHFIFGINNRPFFELVGAAGTDTGNPPDPGSAGGILGVPAADSDKFDEVDQGFEQTSNDLSGFAHMHWRFLPTWGLELGGRYTTEQKSGRWNQVFTTPEPNTSLRAIGAAPFTATRELDLKNFQPKVSLDWAPLRDLSLFVHWEKGFKAGGFNAFAFREGNDPVQDQGFETDDLVFRDEVATNWGFDIKTWLFDRSANLNISLFREVAKDFQVLIRENPNGTIGLGTSRVVNAEEALAQGVEMDLRWAPTGWLTVMSGVGVLKTEFIKFTDGECPVGPSKKDSDGDGNPRCDQSGKPFPFAPELGATVSLRLNLPIGNLPLLGTAFDGLNLIAGTVVEYETEQYLDIDLEEQKLQKAFTRYKADVGVTSIAGRWTLRVVGENLTDTVTWVRYGDVFEDVVVGSQNQPRLLYLQFRQDF